MKRILAPAVLTALAGAAAAQTTHNVTVGAGFSFSDTDLTIEAGDTVQWNWAGFLFHSVESGVSSIHNGIFTSGAPVVGPKSFSVTFDQAFLAANPVPGNAYDYYCIVHEPLFNMIGVVRVVAPYGCINPPGSLVTLSGAPVLGGNWTLGADNPVPGGQPPGSLAFLGISLSPAPGFPCGLPLPGFHMDPAAPVGELLISIFAPNPVLSLGPQVWLGPGSPAAFTIPIPPNPALAGLELYAQALMLDTTGANTFGASQGLQATIGS